MYVTIIRSGLMPASMSRYFPGDARELPPDAMPFLLERTVLLFGEVDAVVDEDLGGLLDGVGLEDAVDGGGAMSAVHCGGEAVRSAALGDGG
jgi:hypothetical protein